MSPPPELIVALRHGEKPVDADGEEIHGEPGLSRAGKLRAFALVTTLRPDRLLPAGAAEPGTFLVPNYDDGASNHRSFQTVAPIAGVLGRAPSPVCGRGDTKMLVGISQAATASTTVICWEHDHLVEWLHELAEHVTVEGELPVDWPGEDFASVWLLARQADRATPTYAFSVAQQPPV
jgi:hypothetical protein